MAEAIVDMFPAALGVAVSPLPIIAVVLILVSARGRTNGLVYLAGQVVGVAAAGALLLAIAGRAGAADDGEPAGWVNWLKLLLGLVLTALAHKQWRARPRRGDEPERPTWMDALDSFTTPKTAGAAVVLAAVNPKNLILIAAGMAAISETGIAASEQVGALVVFTVIASLGVATPVALRFALGDRSTGVLSRLEAWMAANSAVIVTVVLVVIAAKLLADAIVGLSS